MDRLIERVAGLDVHKASVKACVRVPAQRAGERQSQTRTFRTTTAGLVLLWLGATAERRLAQLRELRQRLQGLEPHGTAEAPH